MKLIYILTFFTLISFGLFAQTTPLNKREVAGILRDSLNKPIAGATVKLTSIKDTLQTSTNAYGFFGFKEVKSSDFLVSIKALGHNNYNRKYFNNDTKGVINLPPIRLGIKEEQLEAVTISRLKGPQIKGDTTEFWAKDYIVRDYARLEDLLRRMEGITIDHQGSVFYNGQRVVKALFNNAQYFSGSVTEAMKELPADIVERIQIIDKNENASTAKTLKTEQTVKVMNIVTKADKTAGKMYNLTLEQGTQKRTQAEASLKKIDGTDQISANASYKNEPLGIKDSPVPGTIAGQRLNMRTSSALANISAGNAKEIQAGLSKNFKLKNFNINPNYQFSSNNQQQEKQAFSESYYAQGNLSVNNRQNQNIKKQSHTLNGSFFSSLKNKGNLNGSFELAYNQDQAYGSGNNMQSGVINNVQANTAQQTGKGFNYRLMTVFSKDISPKLTFNATLVSALRGNKINEDALTNIFADNLQAKPDSSLHLLKDINGNNMINSLYSSLTWTKNKNLKIQVSFYPSSNYALSDIKAFNLNTQKLVFEEKLSNYQSAHTLNLPLIFRTEYSFANNFYISPSIGLQNVLLNGSIGFEHSHINRNDFFVMPSLGVGYTHKQMGKLQLNIVQNYTQPQIAQLNPNAYYATPYDVQIGNPSLKNTKSISYSLNYNNFFAKPRLNIVLMYNLSKINNAITSNRFIETDDVRNIIKTYNRFQNISGANSQNYRIDISKTLSKINSTINFSSTIDVVNSPYFANSKTEERNSITQAYKLLFFYSPYKWLELTPDLSYNSISDNNSLSGINGKTYNRILLVNLKTGIFLSKDWAINTNLSQSAYNTTNVSHNTKPFVINANIEKRIFKNKSGLISFVAMDLSHQNYITNYRSTNLGYTNTLTNTNTRYYLLQFSWKPQVWGKSKYDSGQGRMGDGSFIRKRN